MGLELEEEGTIVDSRTICTAVGSRKELSHHYQNVSASSGTSPLSAHSHMLFSVINTLAEMPLNHLMGSSGAQVQLDSNSESGGPDLKSQLSGCVCFCIISYSNSLM